MAPRTRCEDCGRGHNGRESARRCHARATRAADVVRLRGPDGPPAPDARPPDMPDVRPRRFLDNDAARGYLETRAAWAGNNQEAVRWFLENAPYVLRATTAMPALVELVKKYRREAIAQGAEAEDVQEIDDVLKLATEI